MSIADTLLPLTVTALVSGLAAIIAFFAGRRLSISRLKLPFIDFELMDRAAPDRFRELTMLINEAQYAQVDELERLSKTKADLLIYFGWHIVCDTYLGRFSRYPSDTSLDASMVHLGAQTVEFIRIYRETYERNVLGGGALRVDPGYALHYFSRSLSLAERIDDAARREHEPRIRRLLSQLSHTTSSPHAAPAASGRVQ